MIPETKFTPGPWWIQQDGVTVCPPKPRGQTIICRAATVPLDRKQREANAALIAAAPDLFAALEAVVAVADRKTVEFDMAHAAIAKARGEPS